MIIDKILDRRDNEKCGIPYNPKEFYLEVFDYIGGCGSDSAKKITAAMDYGTEDDVKRALMEYVDLNGYDKKVNRYIKSRNWL